MLAGGRLEWRSILRCALEALVTFKASASYQWSICKRIHAGADAWLYGHCAQLILGSKTGHSPAKNSAFTDNTVLSMSQC